MQNNKMITNAFLLSGLMNLSALVFSRFFTNSALNEADPAVMSNFGLLMIVLWGLAYTAVSKSYHHVKWIVGVFAIEKFIYAVVWGNWQVNNSLAAVYENDLMAGIFYTIYGINDFIFGIFFLLVFANLIHSSKH